MSNFTEEQAHAYMHKLLTAMSQAGGSDLFIANDFPPEHEVARRDAAADRAEAQPARSRASWRTRMMNERQREEFAKEMECNFAISVPGVSRFRVNVFVQQQTCRHGDPHHRRGDPQLREAQAAAESSRTWS